MHIAHRRRSSANEFQSGLKNKKIKSKGSSCHRPWCESYKDYCTLCTVPIMSSISWARTKPNLMSSSMFLARKKKIKKKNSLLIVMTEPVSQYAPSSRHESVLLGIIHPRYSITIYVINPFTQLITAQWTHRIGFIPQRSAHHRPRSLTLKAKSALIHY